MVAEPRVIPWNSHERVKCPPGGWAQHPRFGNVRVLETCGWSRFVEYFELVTYATLAGLETVRQRQCAWIDVRELSTVARPTAATVASLPDRRGA